MHRARTVRARACLSEVRACVTAGGRGSQDRARARLCTGAARLAARAPTAEGTNLTVDRAQARVARLIFEKVRACLAAVLLTPADGASTHLHASLAGPAARGPRAPSGDSAVRRARVSVAVAGLVNVRALHATVLRRRKSARATLGTHATGLGARAPRAPHASCACSQRLVKPAASVATGCSRRITWDGMGWDRTR